MTSSPKSRDKSKRASVLVTLRQLASHGSSSAAEVRRERSAECGFYRAADQLPPIVEQTCCYLERHALQSEGLFRVSGSQEDVRALKDRYDKGKRVELSKQTNANTVAGLLKLFFNELTNPVLSYELYPSFLAASEMKDELLRLWCVRRTIAVLPPGNRAVINRVCAMFQIIARFEEDNKMTAKNIALVMNPSMFRDKENDMLEFVSAGGLRVRLLEMLITHYDTLFVDPKEQLEEQVKAQEPLLTDEIKKSLDRFSTILQQGAIELASNILKEGETEYKVQFDQDDDLLNLQVSTSSSARAERTISPSVANMSFEEFQKQLASNPNLMGVLPTDNAPSRNGKRDGFRMNMNRGQSCESLPLEERTNSPFREEQPVEGDESPTYKESFRPKRPPRTIPVIRSQSNMSDRPSPPPRPKRSDTATLPLNHG